MTKKKLIDLMIENNVQWPEGADYAVQDKSDLNVAFCRGGKPKRDVDDDYWRAPLGCNWTGHTTKIPELCHSWHQTIVTREQYEAAQVRRNSANRAREIITHSISEVVEQINSASLVKVGASARTLDAVIANIKECDDKINHHRAELATYTEGRAKFVGELSVQLAGVGMKVVDVEREVVADNGGWPDYCDENGIITDWDEVPEGSEVECVETDGIFGFSVGTYYVVGTDAFGDYGPLDFDNLTPKKENREGDIFRLIK